LGTTEKTRKCLSQVSDTVKNVPDKEKAELVSLGFVATIFDDMKISEIKRFCKFEN
jgi:hypothetical protein